MTVIVEYAVDVPGQFPSETFTDVTEYFDDTERITLKRKNGEEVSLILRHLRKFTISAEPQDD